jgi:hypothetical protein
VGIADAAVLDDGEFHGVARTMTDGADRQ